LLAKQGSEVDEASFGTNINSGILYLNILFFFYVNNCWLHFGDRSVSTVCF
jgi:hypothetical protein